MEDEATIQTRRKILISTQVKAIQRANTRFRPEEPRARSGTAGSYPDLSSVSSETTSAGDELCGNQPVRQVHPIILY